MDFEYDPQKSESNKVKHGIDFDEAQALWRDHDAYEFDAPADEEERFLVVGQIGETLWTAVTTYREEKIRIISVRRSRGREVQEYDHRKRI